MQLLCFRRSGYSALGRGYPVTMEGGHRRLDLLGSAGSCPVSPVWLCSSEGGGIRGRLNLDNLFRDFQGLFFPSLIVLDACDCLNSPQTYTAPFL